MEISVVSQSKRMKDERESEKKHMNWRKSGRPKKYIIMETKILNKVA